MRLKIDQNADALYLSLSDDLAHESEEVAPGIIVDFELEGRAGGIDMDQGAKEALAVMARPQISA